MASRAEPGRIRVAGGEDLGYLIAADLATGRAEDALLGQPPEAFTAEEAAAHATRIARFLVDADKGAWVVEAVPDDAGPEGMLLARFRDLEAEPRADLALGSVFLELDRRLFPTDGRFCEVFQLWVDPGRRRRGWASALKRHLEAETRRRGLGAIYTHTLERNVAVVELNLKLGYHIVRRGPIWDAGVRVSLIKTLT